MSTTPKKAAPAKKAAAAKATAPAASSADDGGSDLPDETRLDEHLDAPSTTAPGDGPADTTDPTEQASSATPDFGAAALAGHDTVNAVVPVKPRARRSAAKEPEDRIERFEATRPNGDVVTVERNIDTGASKVLS